MAVVRFARQQAAVVVKNCKIERKTPALLELSEQLERLSMAHTRDPKAATRRNRARADLHRRQAADAARRHAKAKHKAAK